jgi:hypothetical protein
MRDNCANVGGHYNPLGVNHGGRLQSPFQRQEKRANTK